MDPPQVVKFVKKQYPSVVRHAPRWSIYDRAVERGILPSMRIRWCCADFKETAGAGKVTLIGIRSQESVRRSKRHEVEVSNKKFSGNLEDFYDWQEKEITRKEEKLIRKMKREGKKVNEDEFSLATDNEVRCIGGKDSILISPIFDWSESDVWYFLNDILGVPHCELYDKGYKRIGCILCPMSSARQKKREEKDYPHVKRKWIEAIKAIRRGGMDSQPVIYGGTSGRTGHSLQPTADNSNTGITPPGGETRFCNSETGNAPSSTHRFSLSEWARQTRIFNGKLQFFRNSNITHFQDMGTGLPTKVSGTGFSSSPSADGEVDGHEQTEDEIAELIYDWWTSGKAYSKWYADKFLQGRIDFDFEE